MASARLRGPWRQIERRQAEPGACGDSGDYRKDLVFGDDQEFILADDYFGSGVF